MTLCHESKSNCLYFLFISRCWGKIIYYSTDHLFIINFREENDIDLQLSGKLYDKVDGLEKADVLNNIRYREEQGLDTTELKDRLRVLLELEMEEQEKS